MPGPATRRRRADPRIRAVHPAVSFSFHSTPPVPAPAGTSTWYFVGSLQRPWRGRDDDGTVNGITRIERTATSDDAGADAPMRNLNAIRLRGRWTVPLAAK